MTIYAEHPGCLIGKAGVYVNKFKDRLKEEFYRDYQIKFVEIRGQIINLNYIEE